MLSPTHDSKTNSTAIDDHHQSLPESYVDLPPEETTTDNTESHVDLPPEETTTDNPESHVDLPPESFWVPKGDEKEWFDRNAIIIQRNSSRKISFPGNSNQQGKVFPHRSSSSSSNHKTKASFIGLPKAQKTCFPDGYHRQNKAGTVYLFRNRSEPGGKLPMQSIEPASPQVSCLGMVATKKERTKRTGVWKSIAAIFRTGIKATAVVSKESAGSVEPDTRAPALASLKRLKSRRRAQVSGSIGTHHP